MPITTMNKLPLRYGILMAGAGRVFWRSSHTTIERARSRIREDLRSGAFTSWSWTIVELRVPGASPDYFAPIPAHDVIEGPYTAANPPAK